LGDIELVLANGEPFTLNEYSSNINTKSDKNSTDKCLDVSCFTRQIRSKKQGMILILDINDYKDCVFKTKGGGSKSMKTYTCQQEGCQRTVVKKNSLFTLFV